MFSPCSSIRIPAHFCGVYGFRPSSHRMPSYGAVNSLDGQESVATAFGPLSNSLSGVTTYMRSVLEQEPWRHCPDTIPKPWSQDDYQLKAHGGGQKLCFGIMWDEGTIKPHPPILRALEITKKALEAAGHSSECSTCRFRGCDANCIRSHRVEVTQALRVHCRHSEHVAMTNVMWAHAHGYHSDHSGSRTEVKTTTRV